MQVSSDIAIKEKPTLQLTPTRTRKSKIDIRKAFVMRFINGNTEPDIAKRFGVTKQAVNDALRPFRRMIPNNEASQTFRENKALVLDNAEMAMVDLILDPVKQKKATLGNVAYALDKINNINRLERGLATTIVSNCDLTPEERETLRVLEARIISHDPQDVVSIDNQENIQNNDVNNINEIENT